jgi:anti-sigma regulatory factor (Ser/Thr protein kinase)
MERLSTAIEDVGRDDDWPADLTFQVNLVLEELWLNVVNHGHRGGFHEVEIGLTSEASAVTIEITDDGKPFDPLNDAPVPDVMGSLNDRAVGGLGIHLVRTMMDEMQYTREAGRNHLILVKRRNE